MKPMHVSRFAGFEHVLVASALSLGGLAGCSDAGAEDPASPAGRGVLAELALHVQPSLRAITIERLSRADEEAQEPGEGAALISPGRSIESQTELPILQNDVPENGPASTVELVTNTVDIDAGCPAPFTSQSFCGNVTLRHFFASQGFNNVYVQVTEIDDALGQPLSGHSGLNSDPPALGLSNTLGLWRHTAPTFNPLSGMLGKATAGSTDNAGTRDWVFANPDNADTIIKLRVVASPTYESYSRSTSTPSSFIDACGLPGADRSTATSPISQLLPFPFTLFGGGNAQSFGVTSMKVNYTFKGVITFEDTRPPGGNNLNLPTTDPGAPRPAIYPFWDDLAYNSSGAVCSAISGAAPSRLFVITWSDMKFATDPANTTTLTFSAYLYEGQDKVEIVYKKMISSAQQARADGGSATVGLQNATGTVATSGSVTGGTSTAADGTSLRSYVYSPKF
jgi:hypothetical protein